MALDKDILKFRETQSINMSVNMWAINFILGKSFGQGVRGDYEGVNEKTHYFSGGMKVN